MQRVKIGMLIDDRAMHVAKAYLHALSAHGYELDHIVVMGKRISGERSLKWRWASKLLSHRHLVSLEYSNAVRHYCRNPQHQRFLRIVESQLPNCSTAATPLRLEEYCPNVQYVRIASVEDDCLTEALRSRNLQHYVFAGLDMFRGRPLELGLHFIHVHSGVVPYVRGVHCMLWSMLYRQSLGYSAIYLDHGVDTGNLLLTEERPVPHFTATPPLTDDEIQPFFQFLLRFYNQQNKGEVLVKAIEKILASDYALSGQVQTEAGRQFYKAHSDVIAYAMNHICK